MRNMRTTLSVITSDKVGFKNLPGTAQKFCGKEEDKAQLSRPACDPLHHTAVLALVVIPSFSLQLQNETASQAVVLDTQGMSSPFCFISLTPPGQMSYELPHVSYLVTSVPFNIRGRDRKCGTKVMDNLWCKNGKTQAVRTPIHTEAQIVQRRTHVSAHCLTFHSSLLPVQVPPVSYSLNFLLLNFRSPSLKFCHQAPVSLFF